MKYSEEELSANYDKFITLIGKLFEGERLEKLLHMYSEDELGLQLTMAPASGKEHFHLAYPGGYIDHVINVTKIARKISSIYAENGGIVDWKEEELMFATLHHDLGKLGDGVEPYYIPQESEWHRKNRNELYVHNPKLHHMDVTDRALFLLQKYGVEFNEREMLAIKLSDGLYVEANRPYYVTYDDAKQLKTRLPYIVHWADNMSCQLEYSQWKHIVDI